MNATEAKRKTLGFNDLLEKCEKNIKERIESGGPCSTVVLGVTDITSEEGIEMVQDRLEELGYTTNLNGVNLHIHWK